LFFDVLLRQNEQQKPKLAVNFFVFPSVKFRKIWQTDNKYLLSSELVFQGNLYDKFFDSVKRHKFEKYNKKYKLK